MSWKCRGKQLNRILLLAVIAVSSILLLDLFGIIEQLYESDFDTSFSYPYEGNVQEFVEELRAGKKPQLPPINTYTEITLQSASDKCNDNLYVTLVVKSAVGNFESRKKIRKRWGSEESFPGVRIATVFVVGVSNEEPITKALDIESSLHRDIVQFDFLDTYFNNTVKTVNALKWAVTSCGNSEFYAFIDDDMYVSVRNLLRFLRNPYAYPDNRQNITFSPRILYAGNVENTYPRREKTSKWYVSINEYPFNKWPPFIPAGFYVLSNEALQLIYYTSLYTKMFRFDDIFLSLVAYKAGIVMVDSEHFHIHSNSDIDFSNAIGVHGFSDPFEVWQKQLGANNVL